MRHIYIYIYIYITLFLPHFSHHLLIFGLLHVVESQDFLCCSWWSWKLVKKVESS